MCCDIYLKKILTLCSKLIIPLTDSSLKTTTAFKGLERWVNPIDSKLRIVINDWKVILNYPLNQKIRISSEEKLKDRYILLQTYLLLSYLQSWTNSQLNWISRRNTIFISTRKMIECYAIYAISCRHVWFMLFNVSN